MNKEIYRLEDKKVLSRTKRNICMMKMHDYSTQYHFNIYTPLSSTIKKTKKNHRSKYKSTSLKVIEESKGEHLCDLSWANYF